MAKPCFKNKLYFGCNISLFSFTEKLTAKVLGTEFCELDTNNT